MKRFFSAILTVAVVTAYNARVPAQDAGATAVLDKAIKAVGGEDKLSKIKAHSTKAKGKLTFMDTDNEYTTDTKVQGLDFQHNTFEGDFGGMKFTGVNVLAGDKGWRSFNGMAMEFDKEALANEKRSLYLATIPVTLLALKGKDFKVAAAADETIGDKPAAVLKVTAPDGKDFTLAFDKASGLPVRLVAKVVGFMGDEFTQETTFADYKEMGGIQKATKVVSKRDGAKFQEYQVTEFKVQAEAFDPKTFAEPK